MFKILLVLLLLTVPASATQWRAGTGEATLLGSSQSSLIGTNTFNSIVQPLDNLLSTYCNEYLTYGSSSTIKVSAGSVMVSNSQGTIRLMLQDTAVSTLTSANLDTGSLTANTTYYIYSTAATNTATSSTYFISASNTAPSGQTYYYQIGSFTTDANTQITNISNNWVTSGYISGTPISKSNGVPYQALTDLWFGCYLNISSSNQAAEIVTGSISGSMTQVQACGTFSSSFSGVCSVGWHIRKGDYYENIGSGTCNAVPIGK